MHNLSFLLGFLLLFGIGSQSKNNFQQKVIPVYVDSNLILDNEVPAPCVCGATNSPKQTTGSKVEWSNLAILKWNGVCHTEGDPCDEQTQKNCEFWASGVGVCEVDAYVDPNQGGAVGGGHYTPSSPQNVSAGEEFSWRATWTIGCKTTGSFGVIVEKQGDPSTVYGSLQYPIACSECPAKAPPVHK